MGLKERRAIKALEENQYPVLKQKVSDTIGFEVEFEIDWDSLALEGRGNLYEEGFEKIFVEPLVGAFASICQDDMGKEALKESLKKVVIKDENGITSYNTWITFDTGVLTLDHKIDTNHNYVEERKNKIQETLEAAL
ncbi:MAG: hypothetical protein ACFB0B_08905 [Thermonemataceae bacterium]